MPDITLCLGNKCKKRKECYRFTAEAAEVQSFFFNPPYKKDGSCDYFLDNKDYQKKKDGKK